MVRAGNARRYAQAVFQIAAEQNEFDKWQLDLQTISEALRDEALVVFLEFPRVPLEEKVNILSSHLMQVNPLASNLACLLVARGRLGMLDEIVAEYGVLYNIQRGVAEVEITTAIELNDDEKESLKNRLAEITGKEIILTTQVDSELMGGLVARIGDRILDGSVRYKLARLRQDMVGA